MKYLIIDGYNVIFTCGLEDRRGDAHALRRARQRLYREVSGASGAKLLRNTTIVFDAEARPAAATTNEYEKDGMKILFADAYADADTLIKELIRKHATPGSLTVISSDHQVQRAARAKRATAIDSNVWYDAHVATDEDLDDDEGITGITTRPSSQDLRNPALLSNDETAALIEEFESTANEQDFGAELESVDDDTTDDDTTIAEDETAHEKSPAEDGVNPFPPGWFDDLEQ